MNRIRDVLLTLLLVFVLITPATTSAKAASITIPPSPDPVPGGSLDPLTISKYVSTLTIPAAMPKSKSPNKAIDYYEIAIRQFQQQVLPKGMPKTTVWGYGSITDAQSFSYPARTIEATWNRAVRVKWINDLKDPITGNYLSHLLPIDQTLHWANPPGGIDGRDMTGTDQTPYTGPVPIITHLHGAHVTEESDGYPTAWYLPNANNIPAGYATRGSNWGQIAGVADEPGAATFQYANDQRATTLWYHDHTMGMTRNNVYAGPAGFYLIRGGPDDLAPGVLPSGAYEIPLVIQDKSFNTDGSLFYPDNRAFFEGLTVDQLQIPFAPDTTLTGGTSDVAPIWNPEFFGNTIVVNGKTWPYFNVQQRRYRVRLLNASDSRFLILELSNGGSFWQIGSDGGFLPTPVQQNQLLIAPAERADIILDFTNVPVGTNIILQNVGPDEPFGGGQPGIDFAAANPDTTGQVMQFRVVARKGNDNSTPLNQLQLPAFTELPDATNTRQVSLNEEESATVFVKTLNDGSIVEWKNGVPFGPTEAVLGAIINGVNTPHEFADAITENPSLNTTEVWEINNFTVDAHPIHIHLVQFQVVNREDMLNPGVLLPPDPGEVGYKDTVIAYPGFITRIKARFDIAGLFLWHCHILSHEDNEMMRPYRVVP